MKVTIRKFEKTDIAKKIEWINKTENNKFLHYDIPLEIEKTEKWFELNQGRLDRYDAVIEADGIPVGLTGLLSIDRKNRKAEYYVSMGESAYKSRGIAGEATRQVLSYGFSVLELNRIYLYTETTNQVAQRLFEKIGFAREGVVRQDLFYFGRYVDRVIYSILKTDYEKLVRGKQDGIDGNTNTGFRNNT